MLKFRFLILLFAIISLSYSHMLGKIEPSSRCQSVNKSAYNESQSVSLEWKSENDPLDSQDQEGQRIIQKREGKFIYQPISDQKGIPEWYHLQKHEVPWKMQLKYDLAYSKVLVYDVQFPSPVKSKYECNNTVHAELYLPKSLRTNWEIDKQGSSEKRFPADEPIPAVIILDVLAGEPILSRTLGLMFAENGIAGLFVQMAYYGPRRPANGPKLLTTDLEHTKAGIRQTVLDCRIAAAWLEQFPGINKKRIGMIGTSLGSFMTGITGAMEPRLNKIALLLSGGGLIDAYWDHPKAKPFTKLFSQIPYAKDYAKTILAPVDPITYAPLLKQRSILMIAASEDEVVPPRAAKALWNQTGKQQIIWIKTTHAGAVFYFPQISHQLSQFFGESVEGQQSKN